MAKTPKATTAAPKPVIVVPTLNIHLAPGYLSYLPLPIILSVSTIVFAIIGTILVPVHIARAPRPKPVIAKTPKATTAAPKPVIVAPTLNTQPAPGYLSYLPLDIILAVSTTVAATSKTIPAPATIARAPTPLIAITPSAIIAALKPNIVAPTPRAQPIPGYLPYLPSAKI